MNMSTKAGEPRQDFPQAAIQEFKVFTSQPPCRIRRPRRRRRQRRHQERHEHASAGEGYEFFRNKHMNKVDKFTAAAVKARHVAAIGTAGTSSAVRSAVPSS